MTATIPGAINLDASQLSGTQIIQIGTQGPRVAQTTLSNLAQYIGSVEKNVSNTAITTVGAGTLTAAGLVGGLITRSGPTAAYTDTTATAAQLLTALGSDTPVGTSFLVWIKNTVPFAETLAGGTSVTLSGQTIIPPNSAGLFLITYATSAPTFTMVGIAVDRLTSSPLIASTTLSTVGAGTITAAGIAGGVTTRTGSQSNTAFTDTTDTADNIIAALPNANIGQSFIYYYKNTTDAAATIAGGTGVTVSVVTVVPANCQAAWLITYTAASTMTMVGLFRTIPNTTSGTFVANGATPVTVTNSLVTASSNIIVTLKTVGGTVSPTRPNILTITPGTGFTVGGVASDTSTYNYLIVN